MTTDNHLPEDDETRVPLSEGERWRMLNASMGPEKIAEIMRELRAKGYMSTIAGLFGDDTDYSEGQPPMQNHTSHVPPEVHVRGGCEDYVEHYEEVGMQEVVQIVFEDGTTGVLTEFGVAGNP